MSSWTASSLGTLCCREVDAMLAADDATSSHPTPSASAELSCGTHQPLLARQDVITAKLVFAEKLVSIPEIAHACSPNFILERGGRKPSFRGTDGQNQGNCMRSGTHAPAAYVGSLLKIVNKPYHPTH